MYTLEVVTVCERRVCNCFKFKRICRCPCSITDLFVKLDTQSWLNRQTLLIWVMWYNSQQRACIKQPR